MQQQEKQRTWASSRRVMLVMMSLSTLYNYLYSMSVSSAYGLLPILGGALLMTGTVATTYTQTFLGENRKYLTHRLRVLGTLLLVVMLLFSLILFTIYPIFTTTPYVWALFAVVLVLTMRAIISRRLTADIMRGRIGKAGFIWLYAGLQVVAAGVIALLFFQTLPGITAWQTLGGYGLSLLLESYTHWRERRVIAMERETEPIDMQTVESMDRELRTVHAYGAYQRLHMLILMALQVTLVMVYTFIGITSGEIIIGLAVSVACTIIMREGTDFIFRHLGRRKPTLLNMLLIGLFLWFYGLVLFYRQLDHVPNIIFSYLILGLCSSGLSVSVTSLAQMEREMTEVAEYGLQNHMRGYDRIRAVYTEMAILFGQMIALVLLAFLCLPAGIDWTTLDFTDILASFRPLMVAPPLLLLVAALFSVLHFPMNNRHFEKLKRFLTLRDEDNPALKKQLDEVVVKKHKNRFGVKLIVLLLRPLYYHRVVGVRNADGYEEGSIILVSNHGELYGPVVTNLYIPISFRPWCISSMMEKDVIVRYIYENTLIRQKWLPNFLKMPLTKIICPLCLWVFNSLEAIPVYRDNPRELIKTFRKTIEAMQAGDNILVFSRARVKPKAPGQKGYVSEGVGDLYTGFAMIAPAYYQKTHKKAVFIPIYASKRLRTISFGQGIIYRPEAPATQEKLRIVSELQAGMEELYQAEEQELSHLGTHKFNRQRYHWRLAAQEHQAQEITPDANAQEETSRI